MSGEMQFDFDVAVIGGGPAGSSAARRLARLGASVVLVEKTAMPRRKLCGGALSEQAISYLDFPLPSGLTDWECYGARVHYDGRTLESRAEDRIAILVTRAKFDHYLLNKAEESGVETIFDRAISLSDQGDGVTVGLQNGRVLQARKCIIATGATSGLIEKVRRRDNPDEEGFCLEAEVPVRDPDPFSHLHGLIDIYFGGAEFGYGWLFHHGTYYSVGVGGLRSKFRDPKSAMERFCQQIGIEGYQQTLQGHAIPRGGIKRQLSRRNLFLAGDAAGFVDPFYGEGLAYAIRSGQIAAEQISKSLTSDQFDPHKSYRKQTNQEFNGNLKYSLLFSKMMYSIPKIFLSALVSDERILNAYLDVPLNRTTYRKYILWLIPRIPLFLARKIGRRG